MELVVKTRYLSSFYPLLQRGAAVPALVGSPLRSLLCEQFAIPAEYVAGRITTIFLNNRPVDDLDGTIIADGARLTLSAAMPGLVGATMRRSGFYAAFRQGISHPEDAGAPPADGSGTVRLKLFNLLLPELAPLVLARGILLEPAELAELLTELPEHALPSGGYHAVGATPGAGPDLLSVTFED